MSSRLPIQQNSSPFCWSCVSTLRSLQQILFPQVQELRAQASTFFLKVRRMLFCSSQLILEYFWPTSTLLRGHLALATLSLPETEPQFLERGGYADEIHLGKSERKILVSNFSVTCSSFREFYTLDWSLHVWALPENRLRRLHVLKYTTQLSCVGWSTSSRSSFQLVIWSHRTSTRPQ